MDSDLLRRALVVFALAGATRTAVGQCPDGTLASKTGQCGGPRSVAAINPNRLAILPFRTTGLDPSLKPVGAGIADLLSASFNGAIGPAAVEPGEAYRAWARTGGEKQAITQTLALQIARGLGAGQVVMGSVIGTGGKLTVVASILTVPNGAERVSQVRIEGTEDRLGALTTTLATQLQGRSVGVTGVVSDEAVRAYIDGLDADHTSRPGRADNLFLRAARLDTTFIPPAYRLVIHRALFGPTLGVGDFQASFTYMWKNRQRLGVEQRVLLEAVADSSGLVFRAQALPRMERAIGLLPNSADAWAMIGDMYFHVGALIGRENWAELAKHASLRALQLDATLLFSVSREDVAHLAYADRDVKTFNKYAPDEPLYRYLGALLRGNPDSIRSARLVYAQGLAVTAVRPTPRWVNGFPLPQREVDSLLVLVSALANSDVGYIMDRTSHNAGRPNRAAVEDKKFYGSETRLEFYQHKLNWAYDDSAAAEQIMLLLERSDSLRRRGPPCEVALSRLRRGDTTGANTILTALAVLSSQLIRNPLLPQQLRRGDTTGVPSVSAEVALAELAEGGVDHIIKTLPPRALAEASICAHVLRGVLASLQPSGGPLLRRADSLMRYMPRNIGDPWNYDLGLAFARRGDFAMAASAVRRHAYGIGTWEVPRMVISLRQEGRWAALAGDTAAAIKAYRQYLIYRESPEPVLIPERDSVRAELLLLDRARSRRRAP